MHDRDVYFVDHSAMDGHDFMLLNIKGGGRAVLVRADAGPETWSAVLEAWDACASSVFLARASHGLRTGTHSPGMSSADACLPKE